MTTNEVLQKVDLGISVLIDNEIDIIKRGLNELNLNGHLRGYLRPIFPNFDVDPEYNGDILKENDRKALTIAKNRMIKIGITPN